MTESLPLKTKLQPCRSFSSTELIVWYFIKHYFEFLIKKVGRPYKRGEYFSRAPWTTYQVFLPRHLLLSFWTIDLKICVMNDADLFSAIVSSLNWLFMNNKSFFFLNMTVTYWMSKLWLRKGRNLLSSFSLEKVCVLFPRGRLAGSVACTSFGPDKPYKEGRDSVAAMLKRWQK